jgi:predicted MPP superfamily phosphohydrolase
MSLVDRGLTRPQREILIQLAVGEALTDDDVVTQLHDHGAIVRGDAGQWEIENRVLARYIQAVTSRPTAAPAATSALTPAPTPAPPPVARPSTPIRVFSWIHLSDLHFGAGTTGYRFDHKAVMRAIERDLTANAPRPIDHIFVTGDIAFSAQPDEYTCARKWFEPIVKAAGVGFDRMRFVPGNHDVDRQAVKKSPLLRSAHHAARERRVELDELLADDKARAVLAAKLEPYRAFVSTFTGHPAPIENGIDWFEILEPGAEGHGRIRIAGLSTVWTSDELDGKDEGGKGFVRNLMLAHGPLDRLAGEATAAELTLLLTHHPPEWIAPRADGVDLLTRELARLPHIHLSGHVHDAKAGSTKRHGRSGRSLWYGAGAAHSDPSESAKHGYAWGAVRYDPAKAGWQAGWAPRIYVDGEMRADRTPHELDAEGFAWEEIACPWPAPSSVASPIPPR